MCGSATLAMVESRMVMKLPSITTSVTVIGDASDRAPATGAALLTW
jgi:hypothetical protein